MSSDGDRLKRLLLSWVLIEKKTIRRGEILEKQEIDKKFAELMQTAGAVSPYDSDNPVINHQWTAMIVVPVEIRPSSDEAHDPMISMAPEKLEAAIETATYGCFRCNMGLEEGWHTPCPGEDVNALRERADDGEDKS